MLYTQITHQGKNPITVENLKSKLPSLHDDKELWVAIANMKEENYDYIFTMTKDGKITTEEARRVVQIYRLKQPPNTSQKGKQETKEDIDQPKAAHLPVFQKGKQETKEDIDQPKAAHLPVFQKVAKGNKQLHTGLTEYVAQTTHGTWRIAVHADTKNFGLQCQITFEKEDLKEGSHMILYQAVSRLRGGINDVANQKLVNGIQSLDGSNVRLATANTIAVPYAKIPPQTFSFGSSEPFTDEYVMAFMDTTKTSDNPAYNLDGMLNWGQGGKMGGVAVDKTRKPEKKESGNSKKFHQLLDNTHIATLGDRPQLGDDAVYPTYRGTEEDKKKGCTRYKQVKQRSQLQSGSHHKSGMWFETTVLLTSKDKTSTYLGSIHWGFEVQRGKVENVFPRVLSKDTPTRFFQQAATAWNDQASTKSLQKLYAPWDE